MCGYRALRGACSGDCGAHRLLKNSIQRSSPTKSCVLYRFVVSIGGFVDMNSAKSGDFWFYNIVKSPCYLHRELFRCLPSSSRHEFCEIWRFLVLQSPCYLHRELFRCLPSSRGDIGKGTIKKKKWMYSASGFWN